MKKAENSIGIILSINNSTLRILLLDKYLGKINVPLPGKPNLKNNNLCNGALISYYLHNENEKIKIQDFNILDVPFLIARKNILFFHHIIELCNYFIPIGMPSDELFQMLLFALYSFDELDDLQKQKIFLTKFFLCVGNYPENDAIKSYIYKIMMIPIDSISNTQIDLKYEKELSLWIIKCMNMHPYFRYFKTTNFLDKIIIS